MSAYLDAIGGNRFQGAEVGFRFRPKRLLKRVGMVALAATPVGVAYGTYKGAKFVKRKVNKRKAANRAKKTRTSQSAADESQAQESEGQEEQEGYEDSEQDAAPSQDDDGEESVGDNMPDEIGWDEIGDDVDSMLAGDEYVGGPRRGAAPQGPNAALVRQRGFAKSREYPLGFSSVGTIAAAASSTVTAQPQTLFRPKRLVIPSSIAGSFTIQDIKVGNTSQLVASGSLPAALYSELAVGTLQRFDTASPGIIISLAVTNTSAGALAFVAAMIGDSVQ